jgi:O-antigen/teichoic acid export membrane protein
MGMPDDSAATRSGETEETPTISAGQVRTRAVQGVMSVAVREVALRVIGLGGNLVLARLLTPKDFGTVAFGYTLIAFGTFLADGGVGSQLIQRPESPTRLELRALQGFTLLLSLAALLLVCAVGLPLGRPGEIAAVMALSVPINGMCAPSMIVAERQLMYQPIVRSDIAQVLSFNVLAIVLVAIGVGVWGLAIALVVSSAIGTVTLLVIGPLGFVRPNFRFKIVRPFLRYGLQFQAAGVVTTVRDQGLNLVAAGVGGLAVLGIWSLANRILQGVVLVFNTLWRVSFPAIARLIEAGEDPRESVEHGLSLSTVLTGFAVVAFGGTAPALVPFCFGARWDGVIPVMPWAAAGLLVAGPISVAGVSLLYARGEPRTPLIAVIAHTAVWFAVSVPLIGGLGAEALGIGWSAGAAVDAAILSRGVARYGVRVVPSSAPPFLVAAASGIAAWLVASSLHPHVLALAASLAVGEGAYLGVILCFRRSLVVELCRLVNQTLFRRHALA